MPFAFSKPAQPIRVLALVVAMSSVSLTAWTEPAPPPVRAWTTRELISRALEHNPELRAQRWDTAEADAGVKRASALPNPSIRLEWLHAQEDPDRMGWGIGLRWTPPQPTEFSARKAAARAHRAVVDAEILESSADLVTALQLACATADELAGRLRTAEHAVQVRASIESIVRDRVAQGASTRLDLGLARLSVARAEQERDALAIRRGSILRQIATLAALPPDAPVEVVPDDTWQSGAGEVRTVADAQALALRRRPILTADAARSEEKDQSVRAEKARQWPWISFSALPRYRFNDSASQRHDLAVQLDVSVPIFDSNRGRIEAAEAERSRQAAMRSVHEAQIRREVADAFADMNARRAALDRYATDVEPVLRDHAELVQIALKGQQVDIAAVLNAEDLVLRSQHELGEARLAFRKSLILLRRACGLDPSR